MYSIPAVITLTEFRRTVRVAAGDRKKALMLLGLALFIFGPITAIGTLALSDAGERVAAGTVEMAGFMTLTDVVTVTDIVTGGAAMVWLLFVVLAAMRTVTTVGKIDEPAFLLLSTSLRNVVIGLLGAEFLGFVAWFAVPLLVLASAFAYGAGTVAPVLLAPLVVCLLMVSAIPIGFGIGICIRHVLTTHESIARYRTPLFVAIALAYFAAVSTDLWSSLMETLFTLLQDSPLGWPGHLLLLGIPNVSPSIGPAVGAIVGIALVTPIAVVTGVAVARIHWYADPVQFGDDSVTESDSTDQLASLLGTILDRRTLTVTLTAIRRTKRAPIRLLYVAYPLLGILPFAGDIVQTGTVPSFVAVLLGVYVVWGSGVLFTLNPLGDLGRAMPAVLTATISGRHLITGRVVASALVSVPIGILVSAVAGVASPLSMTETGTLVAATAVGTVAAPGLATGVGTAFPRFGSVRLTNNREAVMPSKSAFIVYSLVIGLTVAAAAVLYVDSAPTIVATVLSALVSSVPSLEVSVSPELITGISWIVVPVGLLSPIGSFVYAIREFDEFRFD